MVPPCSDAVSPSPLVTALRVAVAPVDDVEVQGQIRLFSAWLEGQLRWRQLPGVVVGVVADQELVWSQGFGLADIASGVAHPWMEPSHARPDHG